VAVPGYACMRVPTLPTADNARKSAHLERSLDGAFSLNSSRLLRAREQSLFWVR
jgi:hypothetical protein